MAVVSEDGVIRTGGTVKWEDVLRVRVVRDEILRTASIRIEGKDFKETIRTNKDDTEAVLRLVYEKVPSEHLKTIRYTKADATYLLISVVPPHFLSLGYSFLFVLGMMILRWLTSKERGFVDLVLVLLSLIYGLGFACSLVLA